MVSLSVAGFDLDLHEDYFNETEDGGTLKHSLTIEQKISKKSEVEPAILQSCSFKLEVNDRAIYDLSQEEAVDLIKSFEADPELKRYDQFKNIQYIKYKQLLQVEHSRENKPL